MPIYSPSYYNSAALLGGGRIRRGRRRPMPSRASSMSGVALVRNSVPVRKGSPEAKAKMAALRAMRRNKQHRRRRR